MTSVHTNLVTRDRIRSFKFSYMKKTSGRSAWNNVKNGSNNSITLNATVKWLVIWHQPDKPLKTQNVHLS